MKLQRLVDGVERALARAGELEFMVQNEVTNLERSYTDSEIKLRGLVSEMSIERETIETHAEKLRNSISDTHSGLSDELLVAKYSNTASCGAGCGSNCG